MHICISLDYKKYNLYIFISFLFNPFCPGTILLCPVHGQTEIYLRKIKSKFIHINICLNVTPILSFLNVLTPKIR